MIVTFGCGHTATVSEAVLGQPRCSCGNDQVTHVKSRAPRFRGVATGPYCETVNLEPGIVNVAPGGPLTLVEPKD